MKNFLEFIERAGDPTQMTDDDIDKYLSIATDYLTFLGLEKADRVRKRSLVKIKCPVCVEGTGIDEYPLSRCPCPYCNDTGIMEAEKAEEKT